MHSYTFLEKILFFPPFWLNKQKLHSCLSGKTMLITGASSGIGRQLAYSLAHIPLHLILVARQEEQLITIKKDIEQSKAKVSIFRADLRNHEEAEQLLVFLHRLPDGLDIFVSNAGLSIQRSIQDSLDRYHDFSRTMAINYFAPVQLLLSIIPLLQQNNGHVINISTINTRLLPVPYWAAYQASKSAFDTWFRSASPELEAMRISTTSIYLPLVKTPMIEPTAAYKQMPAMSSEHVAAIIGKVLYTKQRTFSPWWLIIGETASVLFRGTWDRTASRFATKRRKRQ
ncbi:SDR family NAD(P)-dependent oxidoreductase [Domibacillus enclensis]|uniref:Epimerase n=1 Tax=Domibacillus enclensis TaxID=1017273 RepID=A0A1N6Y3I3_9BACI|nr:SDR family NAD(P)-dependent oxidoreductase [Domibacillus enclensis]OXS77502.1 epimerase [Domibacillus enclensis]SIR09117.1 Short-chain dehydrogenase [Domibacillus enclensis]